MAAKYWKPTIKTDDGGYLAVSFTADHNRKPAVQEYAGKGRTGAEATLKATVLMWRDSRRSHGLPEELVSRARVINRPHVPGDA